MTWYAASVIIWVKRKPVEGGEDGHTGPCHVWENVIIVDAADPDEAIRKATEFGQQDAAANSVDLIVDDQPGEIKFMGVRKLSEIHSLAESGETQPKDLVEITSSELEMRSYEDLVQFARGDAVILRYVD